MIWQVWADITISLAIPITTIFLYYSGRIQRKHLWLMIWGFAVGSTWEFAFYFLGDTLHAMHVKWPMPIITLHLLHTFWDAGLFIVGYWLCLLILGTQNCCKTFRWIELTIMLLWGVGQEFVVELLGNGVIWEYKVQSWNPTWITIGEQGYTLLPQLIWAVAPIVYYLGFVRINRDSGR
ncbi:hypothetical protein KKA14_10730, partial [bacterium]|nr:hypothetical protein [bacterium]